MYLELLLDTKQGMFRYQLVGDITIGVAPTGSGKTYATMELVKQMLQNGDVDKAVFSLPTKALVGEVHTRLLNWVQTNNLPFKVVRDDSDARLEQGYPPSWEKADIIVSTYERTASVLMANRRLLKRNRFLFVIDEFHFFASRTTAISDIVSSALQQIVEYGGSKLILLSATFPELDSFARFFGQFGNTVLLKGVGRKIEHEIELAEVPPDYEKLVKNALDWIEKQIQQYGEELTFPVFVYAPTRALAQEFYQEALKLTPNVLLHTGLLGAEQRKQIEECLRGEISSLDNVRCPPDIIVATDTLAQGVNFPCNSAVVLSLRRTKKITIEPTLLAQVIGRAGRPGLTKRSKVPVLIQFSSPEEEDVINDALQQKYSISEVKVDSTAIMLRLLYLKKDPYTYAVYSPITAIRPAFYLELLESKEELKHRELADEQNISAIGASLARAYADSELVNTYYAIAVGLSDSVNQYVGAPDRIDVRRLAEVLTAFSAYYALQTLSKKDKELLLVELMNISRSGYFGSTALNVIPYMQCNNPAGTPWLFSKDYSLLGLPSDFACIDLTAEKSDLEAVLNTIEVAPSYMTARTLARQVLNSMSRFLAPIQLSRVLPYKVRATAHTLSTYFDALAYATRMKAETRESLSYTFMSELERIVELEAESLEKEGRCKWNPQLLLSYLFSKLKFAPKKGKRKRSRKS